MSYVFMDFLEIIVIFFLIVMFVFSTYVIFKRCLRANALRKRLKRLRGMRK